MQLKEFLKLLPTSQEIDISTENDLIYEGDSEGYIGEDYEITRKARSFRCGMNSVNF